MPTGVAIPEHCRYRAPLLAADVPETTHFAADARTKGLLVAADTTLEPPSVARSGEIVFADQGTVSAGAWVPWPNARSAPRLARIIPLGPTSPPGANTVSPPDNTPSLPPGNTPSSPTNTLSPPDNTPSLPASADVSKTALSPHGNTPSPSAWLGAWDIHHPEGDTEIILYRGGKATSLGRGDAYSAADLACSSSRCALLTARMGRVAPAGATVLVLDIDPSIPPRSIQIEPEGESAARPFGLAAVDGTSGPVAVLSDSGQSVFYTTEGPGAPAVLAKLPAENGILDATLLPDGRPLVLAHGNVVDEKGCAREGSDVRGAKLRIVRKDLPSLDIHTPGAPSLVTVRPLPNGALLLWLSPLGCGADRRVAYGLVLDKDGSPVGEPLPLADADTFAVASAGAEADVWIRQKERLFWLRLTCAL